MDVRVPLNLPPIFKSEYLADVINGGDKSRIRHTLIIICTRHSDGYLANPYMMV